MKLIAIYYFSGFCICSYFRGFHHYARSLKISHSKKEEIIHYEKKGGTLLGKRKSKLLLATTAFVLATITGCTEQKTNICSIFILTLLYSWIIL